MLLEFDELRGIGCAVVHDEKVIETLAGRPVLAFVVHEGHCYLYSCPRVRAALMRRDLGPALRLKKAQRASTAPPMSEWTQWAREVAPGHFSCDEEQLDEVRSWFMHRNRHPKVLLKDCLHARALSYTCTQRLDGCIGPLMIHGLPNHHR